LGSTASSASTAASLTNPVCANGYGLNSAATLSTSFCASCGVTSNVAVASAALVTAGVNGA